ncbi:DUF2971 domain-containing protein [Brachyspira intermedia]|uniref:DUF2971 domain-containing protein n=1 Tax=Brachyspira intermedia TaxID=84377 RepID=UPI003003D78D
MNDKEKQLQKIFKEIEKYDDGKHDNKIIKLCDDGLKIDNKNPKLYFYKARSLSQLASYNKDNNKYLEAIKNINIVFNIEPDNKSAHYNRGLCYFYLALNENNNDEYLNKSIEDFDNFIFFLKEFEKNIKTETEIIELKKKYGESYDIRALSYVHLNKYDEALNDFNMAIKYNSNSGEYYYNRGHCYYNIAIKNNNDINYLKLAIEDFYKSKELEFYNDDIYLLEGLSYFYLGQKEVNKKIDYFNNAIENLDKFTNFNNNHYDDNIKAHHIKALIYLTLLIELDNNLEYYFNKAIENCNTAIKNNPECGEYYYNRGLCYYNFGIKNKEIKNNNFELAIKDLNKALKLGFNNKDVHFTRGLSYFRLAIFENNYEYIYLSIKDFNTIINSDMNNGEAYFYRGLAYHKLEEFDNSINDLKKSIELNFYDKDIFLYISSSYFNLCNYEEAINNINKFIEKNSDSEIGYLDRATSYINLYLRKDKNHNEYYNIIEKDFNKVLELKPNDESIYSRIAGLYYTLKNYEKCLNIFQKVIELNKENDSAYYYKGLCCYYLKNYNEAIKNYDLSEKYSKYYHNKLSIQDKKIESLLKLSNKENEIYNIYNHNVLELYEEFYNETIFYSYDFFNISSSITENVLSLKNKIDVNENEIIDSNKNIINKAIKDDFYNQQFYYEIRNNSLYNYTRVNKDTLRSILNNTLWCSNTKNFNDPVDPYIRNFRKEEQNKFYDYLLEKIKIACLTTHNDNTLMWSHYADKHQGICIEYDINKILNENNDKILIKKISYNKIMISYDTFINQQKKSINSVLIDNKTIDNITDLFTIKSKEWEYEDEYRILFYDEKNENSNGTLINLPIKSICFGVQTSKEDKELVYNLVQYINKKNRNKNGKKYKRIKLYYAELDDNELFKINIKPYKHKK